MDSKLRCVFMVEDGHAESGNYEGANNEYSTAKSDLPVKATTALSSSPKVFLENLYFDQSFLRNYIHNDSGSQPGCCGTLGCGEKL